MPFHKGFRATIYDSTTSIPLTEYAPFIDPTTDTVTSYIQTTADQPFTIILHDTVNTFSQGTAVYVDGVYVDNGLTGPGIATERRWFGKRIDHIHVRPFIFRANPSNDSLIADDARIGTISLILRRCQISGMAEDQSNRGCIPDDSDPPNIRHLASLSDYLAHRAEYQTPKSIPATLYHVQWLDPQHGPAYMEFKFIYRSKEVLISKGILPSLSAPLPPNLDERLTAPKKRKARNESTATAKKKSSVAATKRADATPSSPTTVEATPPKPARAKKPRASAKNQVMKKEIEVKSEIDVKEIVFPARKESPGTAAGEVSPEPPTSPMIEVLQQQQQQQQQQQVVSHPGDHVVHNTVLPWVESQSATIDIPVDIFRELRELRDEVKRLKDSQVPAPPQQMVPAFPGINPYHPFPGHSTAAHMGLSGGNVRENWDPFYPGAEDIPHTHPGDTTQQEQEQEQEQ